MPSPSSRYLRFALAAALMAGLGFAAGWMVGGSTESPATPGAPLRAEPGNTPAEAGQEAGPQRAKPGAYTATVLRVLDGDTIEARVAIWPGQSLEVKVRLRGIDAPERRGACPEEKARAEAAAHRLAELAGTTVILTEIGPDKYFGRVLGRIETLSGKDIGAALLASGDARLYAGRRRAGWCSASAG